MKRKNSSTYQDGLIRYNSPKMSINFVILTSDHKDVWGRNRQKGESLRSHWSKRLEIILVSVARRKIGVFLFPIGWDAS